MFPVIFHVRGKKFRPEIELAKTRLKPHRIHHVGDVVKRKRDDFVYKDSGFSVTIGPKDKDDLMVQIKAATKFVKRHFTEIKLFKNADDKVLKLCGELKIGVVLSCYYGFTVDRLISHYVKVLRLKYPKQKPIKK
ncbi:MAG TPA: hypothetical protein VII71_00690 [Verrucomicrobiae bacterium]